MMASKDEILTHIDSHEGKINTIQKNLTHVSKDLDRVEVSNFHDIFKEIHREHRRSSR